MLNCGRSPKTDHCLSTSTQTPSAFVTNHGLWKHTLRMKRCESKHFLGVITFISPEHVERYCGGLNNPENSFLTKCNWHSTEIIGRKWKLKVVGNLLSELATTQGLSRKEYSHQKWYPSVLFALFSCVNNSTATCAVDIVLVPACACSLALKLLCCCKYVTSMFSAPAILCFRDYMTLRSIRLTRVCSLDIFLLRSCNPMLLIISVFVAQSFTTSKFLSSHPFPLNQKHASSILQLQIWTLPCRHDKVLLQIRCQVLLCCCESSFTHS